MSARGWAAFAAMSLIWGVPYLFIKVAVDDGVSPVFLSFVRVALGAVLLLALAWRAGVLRQLRGRWRWIAAYAVIEITLPFPLIAAGEQYVSSSLTAILIASVPLIVALLAIRFDAAERATGIRLLGLLIGFAGVVVLVGIDVAGNADELLGAGLILLASCGYAVAPMILKRKFPDVDARASMGASLLLATALLAIPAAFTAPSEMPTDEALVSLVVLGVVCTALALVVFSFLIVEVGPGRALVITYINPVVAVALGVVDPRREPRPGRDRGPAADPGRLVAVDRRAAAPGAPKAGGGDAVTRVLVTGGAGTIGAAVVRRLLRDPDFEVRVSDQREAPMWMREGCEVHRGDLRVLDEARKAMRGCTHVIHLAAIVGGIANFHKLPHTLTEVNNALYNAVFRAALDEDVERFTYVSSSMVFEKRRPVPDARGLPAGLPGADLGLRVLASSPARSTAAPRTTSTGCRTRSAARSTPTGRARCPRTSRGSRTPSRT